MSRWYRFYDDAINDPKILRLSDAMFRAWVTLLCLASKHDGMLPTTTDIALVLRVKAAKVAEWLAVLTAAGLMDNDDGRFSPHNWNTRQYKTDSSAERVKRHREKRAAAGLQAQWTAPAALREAVYTRDGRACVYCGTSDRLSLDHRTPEIRGGTHDLENLATACLACNGAKRDMTETEYREYVTLLKRPQSTDNRIQKTESPDAGASGGEPPIDHRKRLFDEGLPRLARMTGKGPDACRSFVGKCLKAAGDEAVTVLGLIEDAERNQVVDPTAWIAARLKNNQPQQGNPNGRRTVQDAANDLIERLSDLDAPAPGGLCGAEGQGVIRLLPSR